MSSKKKFLQFKRSLCHQSFLIQELYHLKLGLNCKSTSNGYLTAVNYGLILKFKINSVIIFVLKTLFPKFLHQVWFTSSSVDYAMIWIISPLTNKRVQPRKDSAVYHHLLNCNYSHTLEDFSVLCHENKKYLLELKKSLLIIKDRPSMNQNVRSAPLCLFK